MKIFNVVVGVIIVYFGGGPHFCWQFFWCQASEQSSNGNGNNNGTDSTIDNFLRHMENTKPDNCSLENLGPGVVQGLARDRFKQQAMTAVSRANLLTYLWKHHPESLNDRSVLYMLVTNLVESDDQIFGAGNCYDLRQFNNSGIFCPYGYRDQANGTVIVKDLARTHSYDDENNTEHEWFHEIRDIGIKIINNIHTRELATFIFYLPTEDDVAWYRSLRVKYEDGHWSLPYYDCGGGNIWMITYTVPFFGYDRQKGRYVFKGTSGIDIDLMKVDINQCDDDGKTGAERNVFANSHKCKSSTKCAPLAGKGFKRGSYKCVCRQGFYFPLDLRSGDDQDYYNGTEIEKEFDKKATGEKNDYDDEFDCIRCAPGCDFCIDDSPCLFPINWILRAALLSVNSLMMLSICGWFVLVQIFRKMRPILAASPVLLRIILVGALLSYTPMIIHYFEPNDVLCNVQFWLRDVGFATIYSAILFKTWRISIVFRPQKHRNVKITDIMLLKRIGAVVSAFAVLCVARTVIGRPGVEQARHANGMKTFLCVFDFWDYGSAACKIVLLMWGIWLSVSVRKTPSEFNESRFISWAIYNETIMSIFFNVSMFFLHSNSDPDLFYILIFLHTQLTITGTTAFLFASKVYHICKAVKNKNSNLTERQRTAMRFVRSGVAKTSSEQEEQVSEQLVPNIPNGVAALVGISANYIRASIGNPNSAANQTSSGTTCTDGAVPDVAAIDDDQTVVSAHVNNNVNVVTAASLKVPGDAMLDQAEATDV